MTAKFVIVLMLLLPARIEALSDKQTPGRSEFQFLANGRHSRNAESKPGTPKTGDKSYYPVNHIAIDPV